MHCLCNNVPENNLFHTLNWNNRDVSKYLAYGDSFINFIELCNNLVVSIIVLLCAVSVYLYSLINKNIHSFFLRGECVCWPSPQNLFFSMLPLITRDRRDSMKTTSAHEDPQEV